MNRGYIQGKDIKKKRQAIIDAGVIDDGYTIYEDGMPPRRKSKDWKKDFPEKSKSIADLRPGDVLVVSSVTDFALQKGEAAMLVAEVSLMGASVKDAETGKVYSFGEKDAKDIIELWHMSVEAVNERWNKKVKKTMKERGTSSGKRANLDTIKAEDPELYDKIELIWCSDETAKSAPIAINQINDLLPGEMTISRDTLQRHFGFIKAARAAYAERQK